MINNSFGQRTSKYLNLLGLLGLGTITSLIFPPFINNIAGWIALLCFLVWLFWGNRSCKELFWGAYIFGFAFYVTGFAWINNALLIDDGKFAAYIPAVITAIGLFFGLFWAIPAAISGYGKNTYAAMILFSSCFVFMEWIRSFIFTGFPWNLLGTALSVHPLLIQGAAYVGTYGLSLFILLFLSGAAGLVLSLYRKHFDKGYLLFLVLPVVFIAAAAFNYVPIKNSNGLTVRLVQPNIPQTLKWHPALMYKNFRTYIDLTKKRPLENINLVIWGETAVPYLLDRDEEHLREITQAIPPQGFLATGILRIGIENGEELAYNSLFVINAEGKIKDYYDKAHLVPFGEYLPLRQYLPDFMTPIANVVSNLGKGEKYKNIHVNGLPIMGGAICYESIFPKEVINPQEKPEILLVVANDGWYGISAGPYQHLAAAQMRAVEEGITIIRSANTGISAVIADNGEILSRIELDKQDIVDITLPQKTAHQTLYGHFGNTIPLMLIFLLALSAFLSNRYSKKK